MRVLVCFAFNFLVDLQLAQIKIFSVVNLYRLEFIKNFQMKA